MKGDSESAGFAMENCRQQMLARVLLHVIAAPVPVHLTTHGCPREQGLDRRMPYLLCLVLLNSKDRHMKSNAAGSSRFQHAGIVRLTSAGGIERGPVQSDLP